MIMLRKIRSKFAQVAAMSAMALATIGGYVSAQEKIEDANWRFGVNLGLQYNMAGLGYQSLSVPARPNFIPFVLNDGTGIGPYFGLFGEYNSKSFWGAQLRLSYDSRSASITDDQTIPNVVNKFDANLSYLTIEPLFRINITKRPGLHAAVGPLLAINLAKTLKQTQPTETGDLDLSNAVGFTYGATVGFAYDIPITERKGDQQFFLSPFVEFSYIVKQREKQFDFQDDFDDTWSTSSIRAGARLTLGMMPEYDQVIVSDNTNLLFSLFAPSGVYNKRTYDERFPLLPYVFFDKGSSDIPSRYSKVSSGEAANFSESTMYDAEQAKIANGTVKERNDMLAATYYNVMNIYAARLRDNPTAKLTLTGSDPNEGDDQTLAENVKNYMVNTFGADASRIEVKNQDMPKYPSGTARTPVEFKPLIDAENRRVHIEISPSTLDSMIKIVSVDSTPVENEMALNIDESSNIRSWSVQIKGQGVDKSYGPFSGTDAEINSQSILGNLDKGRYTAVVTASRNDGQVYTQEKEFELSRKTETARSQAFRAIFRYGDADAVKNYETTIVNEIIPQISDGARIYVVGHTDNIGKADVNQRLSVQRAREIRDIIDRNLKKAGKRATIQSFGYGADDSEHSILSNQTPEGRHYNRCVVIEVIPAN
ncbi:MAG: OmpA family protein [Bacteroidetes bacterium]|nr:outer membrane beta-barrel protein [Bacteroidota bacterium]MCZ2133306.1 OmpA family protein [Bacteroidota bacterium]